MAVGAACGIAMYGPPGHTADRWRWHEDNRCRWGVTKSVAARKCDASPPSPPPAPPRFCCCRGPCEPPGRTPRFCVVRPVCIPHSAHRAAAAPRSTARPHTQRDARRPRARAPCAPRLQKVVAAREDRKQREPPTPRRHAQAQRECRCSKEGNAARRGCSRAPRCCPPGGAQQGRDQPVHPSGHHLGAPPWHLKCARPSSSRTTRGASRRRPSSRAPRSRCWARSPCSP